MRDESLSPRRTKRMNTRLLFNVSAIAEIFTGLALLLAPQFVSEMLLGSGLDPTGAAVARVLGIGLVSVGVAAWESQEQTLRLAPRAGLCIYNIGAAVLFTMFGTVGDMNGMLLWPAAVLHAVIGAMMLLVVMKRQNARR
jgi:peptidoglycan/LPS O-acetylase OafA/YrhL